MKSPRLTEAAITKAVREFDRLGRKTFLKKYGFSGAKDYFLVIDGKNYDSKAIVAVAHQYLPGGRPLGPYGLHGGAGDAAKTLKSLGYEITSPGENADWSWDEHVLALELYMQNPTSPPAKNSKTIAAFSALLNRMGEKTGVPRTAKFRNPNGIYMKLMNFRRLDPNFQAAGKVGLQRGSALEKRVWDMYAHDTPALVARARVIRLAVEDDTVRLDVGDDDGEMEAEEGKLVLRVHKSRERDPKLVRKKKAAVLQTKGCLKCEVCSFDFSERYGTHGTGFIEAHHRKPVSKLLVGDKTKLSDLALVCANCHRMLHKGGLLDIGALQLKLASVA
jgi:5-methylcytosine-specific restriction protein A